MMTKNIFSIISKIIPTKIAYAHCDIPCGIYDPNAAQLGAHTVIRMTQLLGQINRENETKAEHDIARITLVKEEHAYMIEKELGTLRNDYFKEEHFKKFSGLQKMFSDAEKLSSKTRQTIDMKSAEQLLEIILKISEIFYKTKNLKPVRIRSPYPTEREIIIYR